MKPHPGPSTREDCQSRPIFFGLSRGIPELRAGSRLRGENMVVFIVEGFRRKWQMWHGISFKQFKNLTKLFIYIF
jgi:hypothetical protein